MRSLEREVENDGNGRARLLDGSGEAERQSKRQAPLDYCGQDTLAMVKLLETLRLVSNCKRLTNTPVREIASVLKWIDDRRKQVVSAQATYPRGSSAVGGRVCEQRYAAERVLPDSRFELQHTGSPSKKTASEEKA